MFQSFLPGAAPTAAENHNTKLLKFPRLRWRHGIWKKQTPLSDVGPIIANLGPEPPLFIQGCFQPKMLAGLAQTLSRGVTGATAFFQPAVLLADLLAEAGPPEVVNEDTRFNSNQPFWMRLFNWFIFLNGRNKALQCAFFANATFLTIAH